MTEHTQKPSFDGLGIAPAIFDILTRGGFTSPTPIQQQAIPVAITGKDVVGIAQTGTGKTLAYSVPIMQRLQQTKGRALVVVPTRELALQVEEVAEKLCRACGISGVVLMGGMSMYNQIQKLRRNPRLIVATPGRLLDHMQQRTLSLSDVNIIVLDEADRMFDMGFMPAIKKIFEALPKERQTMLFSATMPADIMKLAAQYMALPVRVEVVQQGTTAEKITQEMIFVRKEDKSKLLSKVLNETAGSVLVFSRTKHGARKITQGLRTIGMAAAEIHSDRSLGQRREALDGFKKGKYRVLVATDIAARGIDVKGIELVINFDLPDSSDDYVHRIGRTGRAGHSGHAISFATPDQKADVRSIEHLIRMPVPVKHVPEFSVATPAQTGNDMMAARPGGGRPSRPPFRGGAGGGFHGRNHRGPQGSRPPFHRGGGAPAGAGTSAGPGQHTSRPPQRRSSGPGFPRQKRTIM